MLVSTIAYLIIGKTSLYEKQFSSRHDSPAHIEESLSNLLIAKDVATTNVITVGEEDYRNAFKTGPDNLLLQSG